MTLKRVLLLFGLVFILGIVGLFFGYKYVDSTLPQLITVDDYQPLLVSQVYDRNGKKIGEFFRERRVLVPYKNIPKQLVNAFLAAEDDQFFSHGGINYLAIMRATIANLRAGHTVQGGSTITQQVAKTLLLSSEKTYIRKFKEALLAQRMEEHLSKEDILYLYLNQIYFGQGANGVELAAQTYFRKSVQKLTLPEMAILAGLPKAPSAYSPVTNPVRAKERQVYVLNRMADLGFISKTEAAQFVQEPVKVFLKENFKDTAPYFLETVRQLLIKKLGDQVVYDRGLKIYTSLDLSKQEAAQTALTNGLKELDKRQGFRGPIKNTTDPKEVGEFLMSTRNNLIREARPEKTILPSGHFVDDGPLNLEYDVRKNGLPFYLKTGDTVEAIVSKVDDELGLVYVRLAELEAIIDLETMQWARKPDPEKRFDLDLIKKPSEALKMGDVILVRILKDKFDSQRLKKYLTKSKTTLDTSKYISVELDQTPIAEASLISIDQDNSDLVAFIGGYDFERSEYNRAIQAARQTGSAFKSIVYLSALDKGYNPSSLLMDAPIVYEEENKQSNSDEGQEDIKTWKPSNHSKTFSGDITFRNALVQSLNVPTVKVIEDIGVPWAAEYAKRLGIFSPLNMDFTLALGSSSITLYELTKVFSEIGRLGKRTRPVIIHKVINSENKNILEKVTLDERFEKELKEIETPFEEARLNYFESLKNQDTQANQNENTKTANEQNLIDNSANSTDENKKIDHKKEIVDTHIYFEDADQLISPTTAYLTTSLLKGVIEDPHGTGGRARALGREVAGKTGTTNGYYDAWFMGYTAQFATGVWVGFDKEKTLGKGEVGGRAALPIWLDYMKTIHENLPVLNFQVPNGIVFANIDADTGQLPTAKSKRIIRQAFLEGTEPTSSTQNKKEEDTDFYKQDLSE